MKSNIGIVAVWLLCLACAACGGSAANSTSSTTPSTSSTTTTSTSTTTTSTTTTTTTTIPPTTTTTVPKPETRPITADDPLVVWVIGDSLAGPTGKEFETAGDATGVVVTTVEGFGGTGLASPLYFDWPLYAAERLPEVQPDVVIVVVGTNDGQGMNTANGWAEMGTPEWEQAYGEIAGLFMDRLVGGSTWVYWAGPPIMSSAYRNERVLRITELIEQQAGSRYEVTYIDTFPLFSDENGNYSSVLPDDDGVPVQVRWEDGVHFTRQGAQRLADHLLAIIATDWGFADLLAG